MARVELNAPAPAFSLPDLNGTAFNLADQQGKNHVVLVFNRGFA